MKRWMFLGLSVFVGAVMGFLYWYYAGCMNGTCAITSSPVNSTIYGGVMGGLLISTFSRSDKKTKPADEA